MKEFWVFFTVGYPDNIKRHFLHDKLYFLSTVDTSVIGGKRWKYTNRFEAHIPEDYQPFGLWKSLDLIFIHFNPGYNIDLITMWALLWKNKQIKKTAVGNTNSQQYSEILLILVSIKLNIQVLLNSARRWKKISSQYVLVIPSSTYTYSTISYKSAPNWMFPLLEMIRKQKKKKYMLIIHVRDFTKGISDNLKIQQYVYLLYVYLDKYIKVIKEIYYLWGNGMAWRCWQVFHSMRVVMAVVMRGTRFDGCCFTQCNNKFGATGVWHCLRIIKRCIRKRAGIKHEYVNAAWSWCSSDYYNADKAFLTTACVYWSLQKHLDLLIEKWQNGVSLCCFVLSEVNN